MTKSESKIEMRIIWDKHIELSQYDEIVDGKRKKKVKIYNKLVE